MGKCKKWTKDELRRLRELRDDGKEWSEVAAILGRSRRAVEHKIYGKPIRKATNRGKQLKDAELAWLLEHYKHTKNDEIMQRLGISHSSLHRIAHKHDLTKTRQFMKKTHKEAAQAAYESHKRNGTFPPKGYRIPKCEQYRFQKGVTNLQRLGKKRNAERIAKAHASWLYTRKRDHARFVFGFEQQTGFLFVRQSSSKVNYRYGLRKLGYIEDANDHNVFYYTSEEMRRTRREANAHKYGIRFLPYND